MTKKLTPKALELLQQFGIIIKNYDKDLSAPAYDQIQDPAKPGRRTLERHTGMTWNELKNSIFKNTPETKDQGDKIRFMNILKSRGVVRIDDFCDIFGCSVQQIHTLIEYFQNSGTEIVVSGKNIILARDRVQNVQQIHKLSDKEIVFGIASDLHFGSTACQITALKEFVLVCQKFGVKYIFTPGDIFAGYGVYPGQIHDLYATSSDEQLNSCIANLPQEKGLKWIAMGGNHDYSFIKSNGHNIIKTLATNREDVIYVGFDQATIPILNNVDAIMWHPSGGVPYAVSYRLQKGIEQIAFDELQKTVRGVQDRPKVRFVFAGHLHIQMQALFGSMFGAQCGTFEGQTNYLKRKGLIPAIGGWIVKATLGASGLLRNFEAKFYVFEEIAEDFTNYSHTPKLTKETKDPLFEE